MSARSFAPKLFGSAMRASATETTPTGTLIQKIACQAQPSMTAPPMSGPVATPRPATPPQMPIASGRRAIGTLPASSVSESGRMAAAPKPCRARAAMSWPGSVARAASAELSVKTMMPMRNRVRRPKRSPSATAMRIVLANASVYAFMNHCSSSTDAPNSACSTGRALVMTRLSRVAMNIGSAVAMSTSQSGLGRRPAPRPKPRPARAGGWAAVSKVVDTSHSSVVIG